METKYERKQRMLAEKSRHSSNISELEKQLTEAKNILLCVKDHEERVIVSDEIRNIEEMIADERRAINEIEVDANIIKNAALNMIG